MFDNTCNYLYEKISNRIKRKIYENQVRIDDIPADISLVRAIINGNINPAKNKYLLTDATIYAFVSALSLSSPVELILGTKQEFDEYSGHLFHLLMLEALKESQNKFLLEQHLYNYLPYFIISTLFELKVEHGDIIDLLVQEFEEHCKFVVEIEDAYESREYAIARLFFLIKEQFYSSFCKIFENEKNTKKLNDRIANYINNEFISLISYVKQPINPLIENTRKYFREIYVPILEEGIKREIIQIKSEVKRNTFSIESLYHYPYLDKENNNTDDDFIIDWYESTKDYLMKLVDIQLKYEKYLEYYICSLLQNYCNNILPQVY